MSHWRPAPKPCVPPAFFRAICSWAILSPFPACAALPIARPFSALLAYSYYADRRGIDDVEEAYDPNSITAGGNQADLDTLNLRYYQEHRVRQGVYGELDFNPSPQTGFYFRALHSGFVNTINKNIVVLSNLDAPNATGPNGMFGSDGNFTNIPANAAAEGDVRELYRGDRSAGTRRPDRHRRRAEPRRQALLHARFQHHQVQLRDRV